MTPTTCGDDMEVPVIGKYELSLKVQAEYTKSPGATTSGLVSPVELGPRLLSNSSLSFLLTAPTEIKSFESSSAGVPIVLQKSPTFPAAKTGIIPVEETKLNVISLVFTNTMVTELSHDFIPAALQDFIIFRNVLSPRGAPP